MKAKQRCSTSRSFSQFRENWRCPRVRKPVRCLPRSTKVVFLGKDLLAGGRSLGIDRRELQLIEVAHLGRAAESKASRANPGQSPTRRCFCSLETNERGSVARNMKVGQIDARTDDGCKIVNVRSLGGGTLCHHFSRHVEKTRQVTWWAMISRNAYGGLRDCETLINTLFKRATVEYSPRLNVIAKNTNRYVIAPIL